MEYTEMQISLMEQMSRMKHIPFWKIPYRVSGLTKGEAMVMGMLNEMERRGVEATPTTLTEKVHIHSAAGSRLLKGLEEKGYIVRSVSPKDRRKTVVALTDVGRELNDKVHNSIRRYWDETIQEIPQEDMQEFKRIWNLIMDSMEATLEKQLKEEEE